MLGIQQLKNADFRIDTLDTYSAISGAKSVRQKDSPVSVFVLSSILPEVFLYEHSVILYETIVEHFNRGVIGELIDISPGKDIVKLDGLPLLRAATSRNALALLAFADLPG